MEDQGINEPGAPGGDPPAGGQPPGGNPPGSGPPPSGAQPDGPRKLYRSRQDRVIAGVCGGLGRHLGIDPIILRIAIVVLAILGGAGLLLYLGAWIFVPEAEATEEPAPRTGGNRGLIILAVIAGLIVLGPILIGIGIVGSFILFPLAAIALAGLVTWWLVSGERPTGGAGQATRAALLGLLVLAVCCCIAVGAFWAAAAGGGTVMAGLIIATGVALVAGAFTGGIRWLILPSLALVLPVALVAAAGIDLDGGVGERDYRPGSAADIREHYELGAGSMTIDLRDTDLPAGDTALDIDVGMGKAVVLVPEEVCVASRADVGAGAVEVFDRDSGGLDLDWEDDRTAPSGSSRVVVDADVGFGVLQVEHDRDEIDRHGGDRGGGSSGNHACV